MLILKSYAKLNLYLAIRNKRKDNYHNIETIFERISLADKIILTRRKDSLIKVTSNNPLIPKGSLNLAFRSAKLLQESLNLNKGVNIKIVKRIPLGSGLGGGSSNAAAVIKGLNELWGLNLSQEQLVSFGAKLGSDVPFFLYNYPFALGRARGDRITPLRELNKVRLWHILIIPKFSVSTPLIYKIWDRFKRSRHPLLDKSHAFGKYSVAIYGDKRVSGKFFQRDLMSYWKVWENSSSIRLTRPKYNVNIICSALRKNDVTLLKEAVFNSLEPLTTALYPEVLRIKEKLIQLGVQIILMSGSGPAVFSVIFSRKEALSIWRQLKKKSRFWQVFLTQTV